MIIRVHRKGIIALPKSVRERVGVEEGSLLRVRVSGRSIVLEPLDLWEKVWGCGRGRGSAEEAERELDVEEAFLRRSLER